MSEVDSGGVRRPSGIKVVDVRVSAEADQVPLLRSFAADIAMRLDFDLDAIEDVRMAVDEACSLLVRAAIPGGSLYCAFEPYEHSLRVTVSVFSQDATTPSSDPMGWRILTTLAESVKEDVQPDGETHRVSIELVSKPTEAEGR